MIPQNALSFEQPAIVEETLQLNRWGSGRAVLSFEAVSDSGELSIEANGLQRRVWMLYIRLNGRHLAPRFPGGKTRLILNWQVDLKPDNRIRIVILGRPRATFSIHIQPCPPSPPPPTTEMTASPVSIHHPNDCRDGLVAMDQCASTLTWETTEADSCQILPDSCAVDCVESIDVAPDASTTYTLTAAGDGGTVETRSAVSVVRFPQVEISIKDSEILQGEKTDLEWATRYADTVEIQPETGIVDRYLVEPLWD